MGDLSDEQVLTGAAEEMAVIEEELSGEQPLKVAVVGATTPFGREAFRSLSQWEEIHFVLAIDTRNVGANMRDLVGGRSASLVVEDKVGAALDRVPCDILLDFSRSTSALQHGISALKRGIAPILGGVHLHNAEIRELAAASRESGLPALVVPYFSVGAVLVQQFCFEASRWMSDVEVIDVAADLRLEGISPLAKSLAEQVAAGWDRRQTAVPHGYLSEAETHTYHDVKTHELRIRGGSDYQEVRFGTLGESVSVRLEWKDTTAILDGLRLSIRKVRTLSGVTVGLEKLMFNAGARP